MIEAYNLQIANMIQRETEAGEAEHDIIGLSNERMEVQELFGPRHVGFVGSSSS